MTPMDKLAAVGVGCACGAVDLAEKLKAVDALLHTGTLIVGFLAGAASIVYYWSNRKIKSQGPRGPKGDKGDPA